MSHNALYNLIASEIHPKNIELPAGIILEQKILSEGNSCYFFRLPDVQMVIGEYRLTHHHLSVNQSVVNKVDLISQYHYTAHFVDKSNAEYILHVYFDANDQILRKPFLNKVMAGNTLEYVYSLELDEGFAWLARSTTRELVKSLRAVQTAVLNNLNEQSAVLDKELEDLSMQLAANKHLYLTTLVRQIDLLKRTLVYTNQPSAIHKRIKYYNHLSVAVDLIEEKGASKVSEVKVVVPAAAGKMERKRESKSEKLAPTKNSSAIKEKPNRSFAEPLFKLKNRVERLLKLADSFITFQSLNELYDDIIEKELHIEHGYLIATVDEIKQLNKLRVSIENKGNQLLVNCLLRKNFEQAKQLARYYSTLPSNVLVLGMKTRNIDLLHFLFKEGIFSAQMKQVIIEKEYNSLVDFCFKNHKAETSYIDVLDVLVKQGASLMEIDESTGLPFAALLLDQTHPLHDVLKRNKDLTLTNTLFYKQLNQVLSLLVVRPELSTDTKVKITHLLSENNSRLYQIGSAEDVHSKHTAEHSMEIMNLGRKALGDALIDQIVEDSDIRALQLAARRRVQQLISKLPRAEQKQTSQLYEINVKQAAQAFSELNLSGVEDLLTFEKIKGKILEAFSANFRIIDLREELIEVQNQLRVLNQTPRKNISREQKRLALREKEIVQEINELVKKWFNHQSGVGLQQRVNQYKSLEKELESLNSLQNELKEFQSALGNLKDALDQFGFMASSADKAGSSSSEELSESDNKTDVPDCKMQ